MITTDGQNIARSLDILNIPEEQKALAVEQAESILQISIQKLNAYVGQNVVGSERVAIPETPSFNGDSPKGLIFGRIQSGKTRAMVLSSAMATDNGFRIIICITTDNTELVDQTQKRFINGLPSRITKYKETDFDRSIGQAKSILENSQDSIAIICSKNHVVLQKAINFLREINAHKYATLIFDDEGDQASPDTNNSRRSRRDPEAPRSRINGLIFGTENSLISTAPINCFVSVTGTPQALILQNSEIRPSFSLNLPTSSAYTGGESFFHEERPQNNERIRLVADYEKEFLMENAVENPPEGLRHSLLYFFLAASIANISLGEKEDGYAYLSHPGRIQNEHEKADLMIAHLVSEITNAVKRREGEVYSQLAEVYNEVSQEGESVSFDDAVTYLERTIHLTRRILVNSSSTDSASEHGPYYNIFIGGNSLGRGVTIENLLVTYYTRYARSSNMDTIYQHARMFGYRRAYLHLTKIYMPWELYRRFYNTYGEDEELRSIIENYREELKSIPISVFDGLNPTRKNILDAIRNNTIQSGGQLFPIYPIYQNPAASSIRNGVMEILEGIIPEFNPERVYKGSDYIIDRSKALEIINLIETREITDRRRNNWNRNGMDGVLDKIKEEINNEQLYLCYKTAPRRTAKEPDKMLYTTLAGVETTPRDLPVLWLTDVAGGVDQGWDGIRFIYPTIVVPRLQRMIFNTT